MRYLEIGCAPGRFLAWVAVELGARVSGLDYSPTGLAAAKRVLDEIGVAADLRCEDVLQNSFEPWSFDIITSFGLIEHFDNPSPVVEKYLELVAAGGTALIVIPDYSGVYGRLQRLFDPENLDIHNLAIMRRDALLGLIPDQGGADIRSYAIGRIVPGLINFEKRWPQGLAKTAARLLNAVGCVQPFDLPGLCPLLVLEIRRGGSVA